MERFHPQPRNSVNEKMHSEVISEISDELSDISYRVSEKVPNKEGRKSVSSKTIIQGGFPKSKKTEAATKPANASKKAPSRTHTIDCRSSK